MLDSRRRPLSDARTSSGEFLNVSDSTSNDLATCLTSIAPTRWLSSLIAGTTSNGVCVRSIGMLRASLPFPRGVSSR